MTYIALLRGINVGGNNRFPMKDLSGIVAKCGGTRVRTYIQSGNVIFDSARERSMMEPELVAALEEHCGCRIPIVFRTAEEWHSVLERGSAYARELPENRVLVYFLQSVPAPAESGLLDPAISSPDAFFLDGKEIFLRLAAGAGDTKLTNAYFDRKLRTICTGRNWRTVKNLAAMIGP